MRCISYEPQEKLLHLNGVSLKLQITLKETINKLQGVRITTGAFGDRNKKMVTSFKSFNTTAGTMGNIAIALPVMSGTQAVAEDSRLFVRGGCGEESQVFIDGLYVRNPYNASIRQIIAYSGSRLKLRLVQTVLVSREKVKSFKKWLDQ